MILSTHAGEHTKSEIEKLSWGSFFHSNFHTIESMNGSIRMSALLVVCKQVLGKTQATEFSL